MNGLSDLALAIGVVAAWIMLIVEASSLIKNRLPKRLWHTVHLTSFGSVILGLIHGIQVGSDADNRLLMGGGVSVLTAIVILTATRVSRVLSDRKFRYELEQETSDDADVVDTFDDLLIGADFDRHGEYDEGGDTEELQPVQLYETFDWGDDVEPVRAATRYPPPARRSERASRHDDFALDDRSPTNW